MLNKVKKGSPMFQFCDFTWNPIKGKCPHDCSYCYMAKMYKRYGWNPELRLDEKCFKDDLGSGNFIFIGSSTDMFANNAPVDWICDIMDFCQNYDNKYLFQTKNPIKYYDFFKNIYGEFPQNSMLAITLETNKEIIIKQTSKAPPIWERVKFFKDIDEYKKMVTVEPIMDFDLKEFLINLKAINPFQINIGADSGHNNLPEPPKEKILELITELEKFTKVYQKDNLKRLLKA